MSEAGSTGPCRESRRITVASGLGSGFQPATVRAHSRACRMPSRAVRTASAPVSDAATEADWCRTNLKPPCETALDPAYIKAFSGVVGTAIGGYA